MTIKKEKMRAKENNKPENDVRPPFEQAEEAQKGAFEIMQDMTVEEMQAMFFDGGLIEPSYKVWQLNSKGHRYYYTFENGVPTFYPSVTTICAQTMPTPPHLVKWIAEKGYEQAEAYKIERAFYGTFMHAQFEDLIINREYDLDGLKARLKEYIEYNRLPDGFINYADELKKDVLAFAQFVLDYDVRPIAVEISLVSREHGYAGMIDLPCTMRAKPSSDERINAIVDFKSGRKGFFEEHEIQLHLYKMMWNENFPDMQITKVFNFSPKDWRKKPTYNLKDQTESPNADKIPYILALAAIEDEKRDNVFTATSGYINLDGGVGLDNNVVTLTLSELIKTKAPKQPDGETAITEKEIAEEPKEQEKPKKAPTKTRKSATKKAAKAEKAPNKPKKATKSAKGTNTQDMKESAQKRLTEQNNLLNDDIDI